jgi:RNA polymerase sigma-70 factor (ECF subfamily)
MRTTLTELRRRRVRRWLRLSNDGVLPEPAGLSGDPRAKEAVRRLYAVLDELPDRERLAFVLRHAEGNELTETAALLGVSLASRQSRLALSCLALIPGLDRSHGMSRTGRSKRRGTSAFRPQPRARVWN